MHGLYYLRGTREHCLERLLFNLSQKVERDLRAHLNRSGIRFHLVSLIRQIKVKMI
jgi:hypothetical protein